MARLTTLKSLLAGAAMLGAGASGAADYTLTISSWTPPTHGINAMMWPKFIEMIEEATDGRVTAEIKLGIAPPPAQMDLVMDGAADLSIIFHGYQAGRFVGTKLIELPGYDGTAEDASVAYWRVHEAHLARLDEHRGVKLIALHTHGPAQLYTVDPVTELSQIAGLKLRVPGGVGSDVGAALEATGIQVPAPKVYETLASRAADGVVMPVESRVGFKLTEVTPFVYSMPGGFYRGSFAFIMNEDVFADLPEDIRAALESEVFGERLSREMGRIWDIIDEKGWEATRDAADNEIHDARPEDVATFRGIADAVTAAVLAEIAAKGIDAEAAHAMVKAEMAAN